VDVQEREAHALVGPETDKLLRATTG
jgi:hypothetical protein